METRKTLSEKCYEYVKANPGISHRMLMDYVEKQGSKNGDAIVRYVRDERKRIVYKSEWVYLPQYKTTGKVIGYYPIEIR